MAMARMPFSQLCYSPCLSILHPVVCLLSPLPSPTPPLVRFPMPLPQKAAFSLLPFPLLKNPFPTFVACRAASTEPGITSMDNDHRELLVQHLLVKEDQLHLLLDLQRRLLQDGVDLSDLATEYSVCSSKKDGGMLGWIRKGQMVPEFEAAAFAAPLNKITRVKTKFGWHLLQVLSEREGAFLKDIQPADLHNHLQNAQFTDEAQLIDVREPHEISMASIQGFKAYPLSQFGQWGPKITSDLDPSKDTYVLCHHGVRSMQAAQWLQSQGFKRIYNVAGGIHQYSLRADNNIPVY